MEQNFDEEAPNRKQRESVKLRIIDPITPIFLDKLPKLRQYPYQVMKRLSEIHQHIKTNKFQAAILSFFQLQKDQSQQNFHQLWTNTSLMLKNDSIKKQFLFTLEKLKNQNQKIDRLQKQTIKELRTNYHYCDLKEEKGLLMELLLNDRFNQALQLIKNIKTLSNIGKIIQSHLEYQILINRHRIYNRGIFPEFSHWNDDNFRFSNQSQELKAFIDGTYQSQKKVNAKLQHITQDYFQDKNFDKSYSELTYYRFEKQKLKCIFGNQFKKFNYIEFVRTIEDKLLKSNILYEDQYEDYCTNQEDRTSKIKEKIDNLLEFYQTHKRSPEIYINNESPNKNEDKKISSVTSSSCIGESRVIEPTQLQFNERPLFVENEKLLKLLQKKDQQLKQLNEKIRLSRENQIKLINYYETQISQLKDSNKFLEHELNQEKIKHEKQREKNERKMEKERQDSISIDLSEDNPFSVTPNQSIIELQLDNPLMKSQILKNCHQEQIREELTKQFRYFNIDLFEKIYSMDKNKDLKHSILDRNHLLFVIKLAKSEDILTIYLEKGLSSQVNQSINQSEIMNYQKMTSEINPNQSDVWKVGSKAQSLIPPNQEFINQLEKDKGFIFTLWNNRKFVSVKKGDLLKIKPYSMQIGNKDIIINFKNKRVGSLSTGKKEKKPAFIRQFINGFIHEQPLFDQIDATINKTIDKFEIFQIMLNNYRYSQKRIK